MDEAIHRHGLADDPDDLGSQMVGDPLFGVLRAAVGARCHHYSARQPRARLLPARPLRFQENYPPVRIPHDDVTNQAVAASPAAARF
jgi:hypothetical protein